MTGIVAAAGLSDGWIIGLGVATALLVLLSVRGLRRATPDLNSHALGLMSVVIAFAWSLPLGRPSLWGAASFPVHLLLTPAAALLLGPRLAVLAVVFASVAHGLWASTEWSAALLDFWLRGVLPIALMTLWRRALERYLGYHVFVYLFVVSFFGTALTVIMAGSVNVWMLTQASSTSAAFPWIALIPIAYAEAFLTGIAVTLAVVLRPKWIATFPDQLYLKRPSKAPDLT